MKTTNIIIIIVVIALVGVGAWVLLGGQEALSPEGEEGVEEETASLTEILAKTKDIVSVKYDILATQAGEPTMLIKVWLKAKKLRTEMVVEGHRVIYLMDSDEQLAYAYSPEENMAVKMNFADVQEGEEGYSAVVDEPESVVSSDSVIVGREVMDGKNCLVIENSTKTEKGWIWEEYGLLIRMELTTDEGIDITEIKNIEFGDIPDSIFELPAGVQVMGGV